MNAEWNLTVEGMNYNVKFEKNKIFVNGNKVAPLKRVKGSNAAATGYNVPLGTVNAIMYIPASKKIQPILTIDGNDVLTGQHYEVPKIPGWAYAFVALYVVNWLFLIGGAIGAVVSAGFATMTLGLAADNTKSIGKRVAIGIAIYAAVTIVELIFLLTIVGAATLL